MKLQRVGGSKGMYHEVIVSICELVARTDLSMFVESIGLRYRECAAANTGIIPSWWQVHDAVVKMVMGKISRPTHRVRAQCEKIQTFDQPLLIG